MAMMTEKPAVRSAAKTAGSGRVSRARMIAEADRGRHGGDDTDDAGKAAVAEESRAVVAADVRRFAVARGDGDHETRAIERGIDFRQRRDDRFAGGIGKRFCERLGIDERDVSDYSAFFFNSSWIFSCGCVSMGKRGCSDVGADAT